MDIVERLWIDRGSKDQLLYCERKEAALEIERLRDALLHIAWGGIQSVDDAEKYARKALEDTENDL